MVLLVLAAFAGGIASALAGWAEATGDFSLRKFLKSIIAAAIAAVGFAVLYPAGPVPLAAILSAFLAGAGADVLSNRVEGIVAKR